MVKVKNQGKYQKSTKWENYILFEADRISKEEATGNRSLVTFLRGNVKVQKDIKGERKKRNRIPTNAAKPPKWLGFFY